MDEKAALAGGLYPRIKTYSPVETEAWQVMGSFASDAGRAMRVSPGFDRWEQPELLNVRR